MNENEFINREKQQLAGNVEDVKDFNLNVVLVQENRYDVRISAKNKEEAETILKNYFEKEGNILYPEGKNLHGVVCFDREADWSSIGSKDDIKEIMFYDFKD